MNVYPNKIMKYPIASVVVFIWIGFVCSISFMEAWLKFHPENVTLPIGLSIGRLIFEALNKVEWILAIIASIHVYFVKNRMQFSQLIFLIIPISLLIIQTFFILPALNERVETILIGEEPLPSFIHFYYLTMEAIKVVCLFLFGITTLKTYQNPKF